MLNSFASSPLPIRFPCCSGTQVPATLSIFKQLRRSAIQYEELKDHGNRCVRVIQNRKPTRHVVLLTIANIFNGLDGPRMKEVRNKLVELIAPFGFDV